MKAHDHVVDLAALIEELAPAPAWVVANSGGSRLALRLAGMVPREDPEILKCDADRLRKFTRKHATQSV